MTQRGDRTRARLIEATLRVVADVGYARASTRAIAEAAGVAEGTIYRHFPDKTSLFFAAALEPSASMLDWVAALPGRAGEGTVEANLVDALTRLTELQERVLPLELAIAADPELQQLRRDAMASAGPLPGAVPESMTAYLAAEQRLGRIAADVDPMAAAVLVLASLFGLGLASAARGVRAGAPEVRAAVALLVRGLAPRT